MDVAPEHIAAVVTAAAEVGVAARRYQLAASVDQRQLRERQLGESLWQLAELLEQQLEGAQSFAARLFVHGAIKSYLAGRLTSAELERAFLRGLDPDDPYSVEQRLQLVDDEDLRRVTEYTLPNDFS